MSAIGDLFERQLGDVVDGPQRAALPVEAVDSADRVDAGARTVLAAHQCGARRLAITAAGVAACESHSVLGEAVDVRRFVELAAEAGDVGVAEIIGQNEDDVGFSRIRSRRVASAKDEESYRQDVPHVGSRDLSWRLDQPTNVAFRTQFNR